MLKTHIVRLKSSLYKVERRGFVLCGNEGASVPRVLTSFSLGELEYTDVLEQ